jgi:APA family basic amino acid/polyamine antiporter
VKGSNELITPGSSVDALVETSKPNSVPLWKMMVLGLCTLQIGPNLALSAGYQLHYSGLTAWLALSGAAIVSMTVAVAISYFARHYSVTASILSFAQLTLPRWPVAIIATTLLIGYVMGPAIGVMTATIYVSSLIHTLGYSWAGNPWIPSIVAAVLSVIIGASAYRGVDWSAKISLGLGIASIPLAIWVTWSAGRTFGFDIRPELSLGGTSAISISRAVFVAMGFFVGFDGVAALASETAAPKRNVAKILRWTLVVAAITFVGGALLQAPVLLAHSDELGSGASPTKVLAEAIGIPAVAVACDLLLSMACVAGLIAWLNCAAIIVATAANDGFLPKALSGFDARSGSPRRAIVFLTAVSIILSIVLLVWSNAAPILTTAYLTNVNVLLWLIAYALICAAAVKHRAAGERRGLSHVLSFAGLVAILAIICAQVIWPLDHISAVMNVAGIAMIVLGSVAFHFLTPAASHQADRTVSISVIG